MRRRASRQRHLIRTEQLAALGFARATIAHRVRAGHLHRIHRGVYGVHPPPYSLQQLWLAATFACGPASAISDWAAAAHLGLTERRPLLAHVTSPRGAGRGSEGVIVHRRRLAPPDVWRKQGIPTTTAARTIVDLAFETGLEGTERMIMAADSLRILNRERLRELAIERRGQPGIRHVLALIDEDPQELRSVNEARMLSICREFGVPTPLANHRLDIAGRIFYADFCWPDLRLIVEADSWRWHGGRRASESDRDRDQLLSMAGWRVVHFTRDQIKRGRAETGRRLAALTAPRGLKVRTVRTSGPSAG